MSDCAVGCDAQRRYRYPRPWMHVSGCQDWETPMSYLDDLKVDVDQAALDRMEAIRLHVTALGQLIDAEDAVTGQGASTYASATFAVRDVYMELRARRRHPSG